MKTTPIELETQAKNRRQLEHQLAIWQVRLAWSAALPDSAYRKNAERMVKQTTGLLESLGGSNNG